jgi:hypothetical protein
MTERPSYGEIKKYFLDPPDPAALAWAEATIQEAERRMAEARSQWPDPARRKAAQRTRLIISGLVAVVGILLAAAGHGFFAFLGFVAAGVAAIRSFIVPRDREAKEQKASQAALDAAEQMRGHALTVKQDYERQYALTEPKLSDEEMDRVLQQDITRTKSRAMQALAVHPNDLVRPTYMGASMQGPRFDASTPLNSNDSRDPFVVYGPAYGAKYPVSSAVGKDGKRRYGRYSVMVICTTRYHLALYRCVLDFFSGNLDEENTTEYHYTDVVAVHSISDPDPGKRINIQPRASQSHLFPVGTERYFELVVSSGDRARVVTGLTHGEISALRGEANGQSFIHQGKDPDFQAVADAVRMMLREKKGGIEGPGHAI